MSRPQITIFPRIQSHKTDTTAGDRSYVKAEVE
jgi:hypothetical protein